MPKVPKWTCKNIEYTVHLPDSTQRAREFDLWKKDVLDVIKELVSNPEFKDCFCTLPCEIYTDGEKKVQIYNEMWTGEWWSEAVVSQV